MTQPEDENVSRAQGILICDKKEAHGVEHTSQKHCHISKCRPHLLNHAASHRILIEIHRIADVLCQRILVWTAIGFWRQSLLIKIKKGR